MALGRQGERQTELIVGWAEATTLAGHIFYDRLQAVLIEAGFDGFAETQCAPYDARKRRRPSLSPGRYLSYAPDRLLRRDRPRARAGVALCRQPILTRVPAPRAFLRLGLREPVPDHSWLSKTRSRLPLEVHEAVFAWVL